MPLEALLCQLTLQWQKAPDTLTLNNKTGVGQVNDSAGPRSPLQNFNGSPEPLFRPYFRRRPTTAHPSAAEPASANDAGSGAVRSK